MVNIQQLRKSFGRLDVLKGVDLALDTPGIKAILGPNGSGKTTLMKSILGMVIPDSGTITVAGDPIRGRWDYRSQLGYLPQIARFPDNLTVRELLHFVADLRKEEPHWDPLVERFGLTPFWHKRLGHLSGGTRQKVNIVLAFMYDAPLLMLDEPTAGLDPVALQSLKGLLREERARGKRIIITSHIMDFVEEMADEIVFLLEGTVYYQGTPQALKDRYGQSRLEPAIAEILRDPYAAPRPVAQRSAHHNGGTRPIASPQTILS